MRCRWDDRTTSQSQVVAFSEDDATVLNLDEVCIDSMLSFVTLTLFVAAVSAGSLTDIKHVVLFMQENRAFDHYFGTMPGK